MTAKDIIELLKLEPHPEGGFYRQTFADEVPGGRAHSTAIYYLLEGPAQGRWHRVDSAEVWHWYAGAPLRLSLWDEVQPPADQILGDDLVAGQRPQVVIPRGQWQAAQSLGDWTLVGCTVAPGFDFRHFEMREEGWNPAQS